MRIDPKVPQNAPNQPDFVLDGTRSHDVQLAAQALGVDNLGKAISKVETASTGDQINLTGNGMSGVAQDNPDAINQMAKLLGITITGTNISSITPTGSIGSTGTPASSSANRESDQPAIEDLTIALHQGSAKGQAEKAEHGAAFQVIINSGSTGSTGGSTGSTGSNTGSPASSSADRESDQPAIEDLTVALHQGSAKGQAEKAEHGAAFQVIINSGSTGSTGGTPITIVGDPGAILTSTGSIGNSDGTGGTTGGTLNLGQTISKLMQEFNAKLRSLFETGDKPTQEQIAAIQKDRHDAAMAAIQNTR